MRQRLLTDEERDAKSEARAFLVLLIIFPLILIGVLAGAGYAVWVWVLPWSLGWMPELVVEGLAAVGAVAAMLYFVYRMVYSGHLDAARKQREEDRKKSREIRMELTRGL